jgi:predicted nucleic acid-binding protein
MAFLLDTNCWMQLVRRREHADDVREVPPSAIRVTDYATHSLILLMRRFNILDELPTFITASGFGLSIMLVDVPPIRFARIVEVMGLHGLDVDDAYHYVATELHGLTLVSLDADFDRTPRGRLTPAMALQQFRDEQQQPQPPQEP